MFISRFIKKDNNLYSSINKYLLKLSFDRINFNSLFITWMCLGLGFSIVADYLYWDFLFSLKYLFFFILISLFTIIIDFYNGILKIPLNYLLFLLISLFLSVFLIDDRLFSSSFIGNLIFLTIYFYFSNKKYVVTNFYNSIFYEILKCSSLFFIGLNINFTSSYMTINSFFFILPYIFTLFSILLIKPLYIISSNLNYTDKIDNSKKTILFSILLQISSIFISYYNNDPILSTSLAIIIPFYFVAFFIFKREHIIRAYIYPMFIVLIFISTRIPYIFIAFFLLFHFLRLINYFLYGKIYPTFKVTNNIPNF